MSTLIKLETTPDLVERVYSALLDAISEGRLSPGTRITQEEIAEQLAVSRQPVLQALRLLKKDGFVQDAPGRGILVAPLSAQWFEDVYTVRSSLDALAARLAATRVKNGIEFIVDAELIKRGKLAAKNQQIDKLISLDIEFHCAIYEASGNPLIQQSAAIHWQHIKRAMGAVLQSNTVRQTAWLEHEAIATAIAQGDARKAETLMRTHGEKASQNLVLHINSFLESQGEPR
jgi:DNA-binding GntR family transcriptional regulator